MSRRLLIALVVGLLALLAYSTLHADVTTQFSYSKKTFVSETATMTGVTLFTPAVDGDYTIFAYQEVLASSCFSSVTSDLNWTDDIGAQQAGLGTDACGGGHSSPPVTIHATAGNAVTVDLNYSPGSSHTPYSVFITVVGP